MFVRRRTPRWLLTLLILALLPAVATAQNGNQPPPGWEQFTRTFKAYADSDGIVGSSVLIMRNGQVLARYHTGQADRERNQPVDDRTIFHWGSITKTLTAVAIMQLRDHGKLSLDDKVTRYIPELRQVHDPYGAIDSITIRMLLAHSAGFQGSTWPYDKGLPWEPFEPTTWNQLVAMMPYEQLHFKPGSRYSYSNPAFVYLARIVEQVSGDPWDAYVHKNIFGPLQLDQSYFRGTPYHLAALRSNNYTIVKDSSGTVKTRANGRDFDPGITVPNGGWNAPLSDLAAYAAFLTNSPPPKPWKAEQTALYDVVLKRSTLQEMWRPLNIMGQAPADPAAMQSWMGLSFFVLTKGDKTLLGHTGSQAGFRAFLYFNPVTSTAIIAAFNSTNTAQPARSAYTTMHTAALDLLW